MKETRLALVIFILLISHGLSQAHGDEDVSIFCDGSWSISIDENDMLSGGAGAELVSSMESPSSGIFLNTISDDNWNIDVSRSTVNWPAGVSLYVKTGDIDISTRRATVSGQQLYMEITGSQNQFITSTLRNSWNTRTWTSQIELLYKIEGLSVDIGAGSYTTTITYTITG
ncbi:MAG: hypothetical protein PF693_02610 [Spirochaetia bacterium]|jgi:hypothetical protein|nr:hypothetical protein [Spirochaetia bacterium]